MLDGSVLTVDSARGTPVDHLHTAPTAAGRRSDCPPGQGHGFINRGTVEVKDDRSTVIKYARVSHG